jgi:CRISPR-associated endonuclease Csn1
MAKKLGIDLGSSSLGWFLRDGNQVLKNGVIIFNSGMVKDKSGGYTSPTRDRRVARSKRRLIQARKYRKWELLEILTGNKNEYVPLTNEELENWSKYKKGQSRRFPENENFKKWLACDFSYQGGKKYKNPYELRVKAIDEKLDKHELGRALYHIIQRRGYKNIGEKDKETKTQIERRGTSGFDLAIKNNRTIAEALQNDFLEKGLRARNEYPYRQEYEKELITILKAQGLDTSLNSKNEYNDKFVDKIRKAIIWQRPLRSQKGNIGKCTLEPTKPRCSVSHPIFEIFRTWQYINTIKTVEYIDEKHKKNIELPLEFRTKLFNEKFLKKDGNFKFEEIKSFLNKLFKEEKEYNYLNKSTKKYDSSVSGMPVCNGLLKIFKDYEGNIVNEIHQLHTYNIGTKEHNVVGNYSVYDLWHLIAETDDDHLEDFAITKLGVENVIKTNKKGEEYIENAIVKLKNAAFSTSYSNLSIKAMCKIIPFLKEGFIYDDAVLLAKLPDIVDGWSNKKELIYKIINESNKIYNYNKDVIYIANSLIDKYKGLSEDKIFAYKDYEYKLQEDDKKQVEKACVSFYGEKTWEELNNKEEIINKASHQYQEFFRDVNREYRRVSTLTKTIKEQFEKEGIELKGELYHHSDRKNLYPSPILNKRYDKKLLAVPLIDSIKNPMFNKAMSILRRLINELIIQKYTGKDGVTQSYIDENTEVIIEVARELNDNNKRIAIERYQRERRNEREKYREFIQEFKGGDETSIEKDISKLEVWFEQIFNKPDDSKKYLSKKQEILAEKDAIKRYQLWMEQKGQCMYTGKTISITQLFSSDIEIEHTIPRSLLPDNTMANLTVCYSRYNSDIKNNRIPKECPNYETEKDLPGIGTCTAIAPRLDKWEKLRDHYKNLFEERGKPFGNETEDGKNSRIQLKHYYKMHYDYWKDKVDRFTADEIKESWVRRQLTDTQMVSKYSREYLKTYFNKVLVQKGSTTADFRKIFSIHGNDKKDRSKHTHHSIDAAVLTLIPTNSSKRMELLKKMYELDEKKGKQFRADPDGFYNFNAQSLIDIIENETLIVNYEKDKIIELTYRNVRKRGRLQYLKDKNGNYILDKNNKKILLKAKGSSIRGDLFKDTYIGKIRNVERNAENKPIRKNGSWKYLTGANEFTYTVRKPITEAKIDDIIDPDIKRIIKEQLKQGIEISNVKDHQGNRIRHVRVKTKAGKKVKERLNYKSKHDYKNAFYSAAGEIPYAIFITNLVNGRIERKMIPVPIHEVAQTFKEYQKFSIEIYLQKFYPEIEIKEYQDVKLLKVGQKVFVLNADIEFEKRKEKAFQMNRMYKITQFFVDGSGGVYLKYHLEATKDDDIDMKVKESKHIFLKKYDDEFGLEDIIEDENIADIRERRKDYNDRKYKFVGLKDFRFARLIPHLGEEKVKKIKKEIGKYKKQSSVIEKERETPLLKITSTDCNFLYENYDFKVDITGNIEWIKN